jgi:hypothetical protein
LDPAVEAYLRARLPKEHVFKLTGVSAKEDFEDLLRNEIELMTDYEASSFEYQILEEK